MKTRAHHDPLRRERLLNLAEFRRTAAASADSAALATPVVASEESTPALEPAPSDAPRR